MARAILVKVDEIRDITQIFTDTKILTGIRKKEIDSLVEAGLFCEDISFWYFYSGEKFEECGGTVVHKSSEGCYDYINLWMDGSDDVYDKYVITGTVKWKDVEDFSKGDTRLNSLTKENVVAEYVQNYVGDYPEVIQARRKDGKSVRHIEESCITDEELIEWMREIGAPADIAKIDRYGVIRCERLKRYDGYSV